MGTRANAEVPLFGTRFVVESRMFGMLDAIDVLMPGQMDAIHSAYMQTVEGGTEGRDILTKIAKELPVDAIVLAGTDLSLVFDETNTDFPHIDGAKVIFRRLPDPWRTDSSRADAKERMRNEY